CATPTPGLPLALQAAAAMASANPSERDTSNCESSIGPSLSGAGREQLPCPRRQCSEHRTVQSCPVTQVIESATVSRPTDRCSHRGATPSRARRHVSRSRDTGYAEVHIL